jgi:hypothetical protein
MTNDTFQALCEKILVPLLGKLMYQQLASLHEPLDIMGQEIAMIRLQLDRMANSVEQRNANGDN